MTVCDCKKGYWHQKLDQASSYLTTFNTAIGRFRYTVMLFGMTVAGDVFQRQPDQCFGKIDQLIVIADDIMVVGKKSNHKDHDVALTNLLESARKCNIRLNFDKLQYRKTEVSFCGETYTTDGHKPAQSKVSCHSLNATIGLQKASTIIYRYGQLHLLNSQQDCLNLQSQSENCQKIKCLLTGDQNTKPHSSR